jgi:hypothetical protein
LGELLKSEVGWKLLPVLRTKPRSLVWEYSKGAILGVLCFFPGFFCSLPFTCTWAKQHYAGEAQGVLAAFFPSFWIGVFAAVAGVIYQLMKVSARSR